MGKKFRRFSLHKNAAATWRYCKRCGRCVKAGETAYTAKGEAICLKCKEEEDGYWNGRMEGSKGI
jgi:hypothetical protein